MNAIDILNETPIYQYDPKVWEAYRGKHVLVTGHCGSIGSRVYERMVSVMAKVVGVDWNEEALAQRKSGFLGDFVDQDVSGYDYIFHCAAYKHVNLANLNREAYELNNVTKTKVLLSRLEPKTRLVLASTDKVCGDSYMGKTKRRAELEVLSRGHTSVRLVNVSYSRGSVLDIWRKSQTLYIAPLDTKRYFMTHMDAAYALAWSGLQTPGNYVVHSAPEVSLGELKEAWLRRIPEAFFISQPLGLHEAPSEKLFLPNEELVTKDVLTLVRGRNETESVSR